MKNVAFILVLFLSTSISVFSQSKTESIKELFRLMKTDSLIDKTFTSILPTITASAAASVASHKGTQTNDSVMKEKAKTMMMPMLQKIKEIVKQMIDVDMVMLYDKYFTQNEIDDYIRFYKTPSGQKYINMQETLQKEMFAIMMQKYMPQIYGMVGDQYDKKKNDQSSKK